MKRFVLTLVCGLAMQVVQAAGPNFVWIVADDMSPDITAYGAEGVKTPNLDRLAQEGRKYTRAYASAPVCSSSRSAFILGCYQTTTGLHAHDVENPQPLAAPYKHLPGLMREAGYFVTNSVAPGSTKKNAKTHYNFAHDPKVMFDGNDWTQRKPGQPFFAQFQISEPHRPFPIPESYDEQALRELDLPPNYPDHPLTRRDWYAYLRSVEVVDQRVGAILDQLEKEGELENTVVMFFADHGRPMPWGKQWLSVEGLQVPLLVRGPKVGKGEVEERLVSLIDLAPSMLDRAGLPVPEWMQGRPLLNGSFPDRSLIFAARDRCGDAPDRIRAVITPGQLLVKNFHPELPYLNWSGYKEASYPGMPLLRELGKIGALSPMQIRYTRDQREPLELYDLESDPTGLVNLAKDPQQEDRLTGLMADMDAWLETSEDKGALPDPPTEPSMDEIRHSKKQDYLRTWSRRGFKQEPTDAQRLTWWMQQYGLPETETIN
ncbi:sulfatase [Prosthecobacter sp. SYSU 5D2]|uniref:sulfatase family protein n=1 Tax=Prosthecobacter sp. SYSU 5D2 TaxID=3134134 RepID=UPI0031FF04EC